MTEIVVEFEEVTPIIDGQRIAGMMLYGKAVLATADSSNPHEFYVKSITLDTDDARGHDVSAKTNKPLFSAIAAEMANDRTDLGRFMQAMFSDAVRDEQGELA